MNAPANRGQYLIREEVGGEVVLAPVSTGMRWPVRHGAIYEILAGTTFENISIAQASKNGNDLVILLVTGEEIVFANYFDTQYPDDNASQARFDQPVPLQLSRLDYEVPTEPNGPQVDHASQVPNWSVSLPTQDYYLQREYYHQHGAYPPPPYPYEEDEGWHGSGILGVAGIALGGLALAAVGLRSGASVSQVVNNADNSDSATDPNGSTTLSSALDLAVQELVERSRTLTLPDDQAMYESIQQDIKDLLELNNSATPSESSGSALDLAVQELVERSKSLVLPADQVLYDSIWQDIKDLLQPVESTATAGSGIVINNNNYGGSTGGGSTQPDVSAAIVQAVTIERVDDYFTEGELVTFRVKFSDNVTASNPGNLALELNGGTYVAQYFEGNGTDTLTFELVVPAIDAVTKLNSSNVTLELSGGTLSDSNTNDVDLSVLPTWSGEVYVEPLPKIVEITAIPDVGEFTSDLAAGTQITFFVKYDNPVTYTGTELTLALNSGGSATYVDQMDPSGVQNNAFLKFSYTLQDGEEANDPSRELLPSALAENGGTNVTTLNGSNARTQITEDVINEFNATHDLIYDLSQPSIEGFSLIDITTNGETIERDFGDGEGVKTLIKVSGIVSIIYDEPVVTAPAVGDLPALAITGLLTDEFDEFGNFDPRTGRASYSELLTRPEAGSPALNEEQLYEFSDVYIVGSSLPNPSEILLTAAEGLIVNMANIVGQSGVPASSSLPESPEAAVISTSDINAGAGPFIADSIVFDFEDYVLQTHDTPSDPLQDLHQYQIIYVEDSNGTGVNYLDEFTGNLTDLSSNGSGVLRALASSSDETKGVFVTPISELMVQLVEIVEVQTPQDVEALKTAISSFFKVGDFIHTEASFINEVEVAGAQLEPVDLDVAVALASLSAMDFVTGSLWNTLNVLKPIFFADASEQELMTAYELIDATGKIIRNSGNIDFEFYAEDISSLLGSMGSHLDERITLLNDERLILIDDQIQYELIGTDLVSIVEHGSSDNFVADVGQDELVVVYEVELLASSGFEYREWEIE